MKTWIPTALSRREDWLLQYYARDRVVVEAGALLGHSTVVLGDVAKQVTSIDHHIGYGSLPNDTWRSYRNNLDRFGVKKRVVPVRDDYSHLAQVPAEFAFIDLDGTERTTYRAALLARAPIVAIHDYQRSNCKGVERAVDKLINNHGFRVLARKDTLVVLSTV